MVDTTLAPTTPPREAVPPTLRGRLDKARTELLDLSTRNRLINLPKGGKAKQIEIVDERAGEVYRLLVAEAKALTFAAGRRAPGAEGAAAEGDGTDEIAELAQPEDEPVDARGIAQRHGDTRLQTRLTSEGLQARLLTLYLDARTLQEEQGVNILYLALGQLRWYEDAKSDTARHAPLILLPVALERGSVGERFRLRWLQEEPIANLSLAALLKRQFGLELPPVGDGEETLDPVAYCAKVAATVAGQPRWAVLPDEIVLGFFSFAKFLMYRDLDPDVWPQGGGLADHPIVAGLMMDGFPAGQPLLGEDAPIDPHIDPEALVHVVDADSSQTLAVHEARGGRNLVIQGPPGTGKSQTIANVIAAAVHDGKKVLFVAEKMAALEVVKRRLDANGIGDICLELHSNKANKRYLLEELRRTWELGRPQGAEDGALVRQLRQHRDALNQHARRLHQRQDPSGLTPYQVVGHLVRLRQAGEPPATLRLVDPECWTRPEREARELQLRDLANRIDDIGAPVAHPWYGAGIASITPMDLERLVGRLTALAARLDDVVAEGEALAAAMARPAPGTLAEAAALCAIGARVAAAPALDRSAIAAACWADAPAAVADLVTAGETLVRLLGALDGVTTAGARERDLDPAEAALARYGTAWGLCAAPGYRSSRGGLDDLIARLAALREAVGLAVPTSLDGASVISATLARVAAAPALAAEAMTAPVWADRLPDIQDLVATGMAYAAARRDLADVFTDAAWDNDLRQARQDLAAHGAGLFRLFSGAYRRARLLVRSVTAGPWPQALDAQLRLLDTLIAGRKAAQRIAEDDALGRAAFGPLWRREKSDWTALGAAAGWVADNGGGPRAEAIRRLAAAPTRTQLVEAGRALEPLHAAAGPDLEALCAQLHAAAPHTFAAAPVASRDLADLVRGLNGLEAAAAVLEGIFTAAPDSVAGQQEVLATLRRVQALSATLADAPLGREAFGADWAGDASPWGRLRAIVEWNSANEAAAGADIRAATAAAVDPRAVGARSGRLGGGLPEVTSALAGAFDGLALDRTALFGTAVVERIALDALRDRLARWTAHAEDLTKWTAYTAAAAAARAAGLGALVDRLEDGRLDGGNVVPAFEMAYYEALYGTMVAADPELARFDGVGHGRLVQEFANLDQRRIALARREVAALHHQRIPWPDGGAGPIGLLKGEIVKKKNHLPIRQLMRRAGPAVQALKPVFMMSPLSVAQFLEPGSVGFDLLVIDEASQIQPVDALGAIARCRQIVVVGDDRQLPPTRFFDKMIAGTEADEDGAAQVADVESILGLCVSKGLPQRMLRWHYRSRHQSLIAISNREFYEDKLYIVPSPFQVAAGMGLRFHHLAHAVYDKGGSATNPEEAKAVAAAVIAHARTRPEESLGVATFSSKQRRAIVDELERLRRLNPDAEPFFTAHPAEPFFVKNLENVQGDERDVIFISVGYGRNAQGYMHMGFGPLSNEGGERRLNVLISRAKRRCEVFSSITDEDIDLERGKGKGVFAFKLFLRYARTGNLSFGQRTDREHDSVFEEQVARALAQAGYTVHPQVGLAGFFIDLAVSDDSRPGRYVLGIECDGAAYHSARSARDRDRLRQAVLEDHGWIIHRIWSTDWFNRPQEQLARTVRAIEAAKEELAAREGRAAARLRAVPVEIVTVERDAVTEIGLEQAGAAAGAGLAVPYVEAAFPVPSATHALHAVPVALMAELCRKVVAVEGPVHGDEVVARLRDLWGLKRAGSRIRPAVYAGLTAAAQTGALIAAGDFYSLPDQTVAVRDRAAVTSGGLRAPEMLPPSEIRLAAQGFVAAHLGAGEEEVIIGVARAFGFKATSAQLRDTIAAEITALVQAGTLQRQADLLMLAAAVPAPSPPNIGRQ